MINLVRDLNPDVLVVAGDVFDQRRPPDDALALFHDTLNRLLELGTIVIFLSGPLDDFRALHLGARWVREAGIYLFDDATQVLSPLSFRGARDEFEVKAWCLPYPTEGEEHPALSGRNLVEKVVQRLDPSQVNLFLGYAWSQGSGRRAEFGRLVQPGGQPLEHRLLDFFDLSALGGRHEPLKLDGPNAYYSGSLLCYEPQAEQTNRSVTFYDVEGKNRLYVENFTLRSRRSLKVLDGSWEELMEQGRQLRNDDLIVLRSEEENLTPEQRADLRILGPNIVSVEFPSPLLEEEKSTESGLPALVHTFKKFVRESTGDELGEDALQLLLELEKDI